VEQWKLRFGSPDMIVDMPEGWQIKIRNAHVAVYPIVVKTYRWAIEQSRPAATEPPTFDYDEVKEVFLAYSRSDDVPLHTAVMRTVNSLVAVAWEKVRNQ